jgi:cytidine deaminase
MCGERVALFTGIAQGERHPRAIVVAAGRGKEYPFPCGACLQVMSEWTSELPLYLVNARSEMVITDLRLLMPQAFSLSRDVT